MNIFVTVGTHEAPFQRLLDLAGELVQSDRKVEVQFGYGGTLPAGCVGQPFFPFDEMRQKMSKADLIVTHGGTGSCMLSLMLGKKPAVMPRLAQHGEHVDDHQLQIAERLADQDLIWLLPQQANAYDVEAILPQLGPSSAPKITSPLGAYLKKSLAEHIKQHR